MIQSWLLIFNAIILEYINELRKKQKAGKKQIENEEEELVKTQTQIQQFKDKDNNPINENRLKDSYLKRMGYQYDFETKSWSVLCDFNEEEFLD